MKEFTLLISGEPVPQGRPRFVSRGKFVQTYDPKKSKDYKKLVKQQVKAQFHEDLLSGALNVELKVYRPIQKSITKKERELRLSGAHRPTIKGDIDNYFKAVTDACTGLVWIDDAQIVSTQSNKYYSEDPHVELVVKELVGESDD
ncbi:RusA family crossover junction endodeoxyribonuclease [Pediococcus inopinatus]|uniref:RusA family crossover junction endodeoxyribonuclease n=1 Tax=Pediococcus inopinatus TaxID=114090 RepID=UPI0007C46CD9|nr:RusA family crossover junction endodeoxyribonuclease [Pediococcus inopinatus]